MMIKQKHLFMRFFYYDSKLVKISMQFLSLKKYNEYYNSVKSLWYKLVNNSIEEYNDDSGKCIGQKIIKYFISPSKKPKTNDITRIDFEIIKKYDNSTNLYFIKLYK